MHVIPQLLFFFSIALLSSQANACTCAHRGHDYLLEQAHTVFVAVPVRAEVQHSTSSERDEVVATLQILDVLKGETPDPVPIMRAAVSPHYTACEGSIGLGEAYVIFLTEPDQTHIGAGACGPSQFVYARRGQEQECFEQNYLLDINYAGEGLGRGEGCSLAYRDVLRGAHNANEKYGFDEEWLRQSRKDFRRSIKRSIEHHKKLEERRLKASGG